MNIYPLPEQKEPVRHGEAAFPIQRYTTHLTPKTPEVSAHWHQEAEWTLITEGSCLCQIQLEPWVLEAGDLLFLTPQLLHSFSMAREPAQSTTFVFHMNLLEGAAGDVCGLRYLGPLAVRRLEPPLILRKSHPIYDQALALFRQLNTAWDGREPGYELLVKANLLTFLALLLPYCGTGPARQTDQVDKLKAALEFMSQHCGEEIAIADVAAACYFSQYHFMRFFKTHMGVSCGVYLKNLRLERAAERFRAGEQSILDVAQSVGFRNLSYFYREFQKKYGMTPKRFLKECTR